MRKDLLNLNCMLGINGASGLLQLLIVVIIIGVIFTIYMKWAKNVMEKSYETAQQLDLHNFYLNYRDYMNWEGINPPQIGASIRNDGFASDFTLEGYSVSPNVCITLTSGDVKNPCHPSNPLIAESKHKKSEKMYSINFYTGIITEVKQ